MLAINTPVVITAGHHAGEHGKIISLPLSKSDLYVVLLLVSSTGLVASPDEFQPIEPVQEETHARVPCP